MRKFRVAIDQQWADELQDWLRGDAGGFLFGIPLLYTMEVWWIGSYTEPPLMLIILAVTFVIVFLMNRTDGFRQGQPDQPLKALMDSVEALAIGTLCTVLILVLLQEITLKTPLDEAVGKVVLEGLPFAIGVASARSILSGDRQAEPKDKTTADSFPSLPPRYNATLADIGATLVGTIFVASNIAPTDEVEMLAAAITPPWLLAILVTSIVLSYCIVFVAGFTHPRTAPTATGGISASVGRNRDHLPSIVGRCRDDALVLSSAGSNRSLATLAGANPNFGPACHDWRSCWQIGGLSGMTRNERAKEQEY